MSALREQIANLTAAEKAELLDEVWESLEADALTLTDTQRAEFDSRWPRADPRCRSLGKGRSDLLKKP